ncbi:hypothetical protein NMY22_g9840 [Coprinellus aureogranulatus]|nr:hypothetical protein NMY22_g9840 [Coprinellus aureogranulatus]
MDKQRTRSWESWDTGRLQREITEREVRETEAKLERERQMMEEKAREAEEKRQKEREQLEWQRKLDRFIHEQRERFKQEQQAAKHPAVVSGLPDGTPIKEELGRNFNEKECTWITLSSQASLRWSDIPWPMNKPPFIPEDITTAAIKSYLISQQPIDKSRSQKDLIKDCIKRWHPDKFETKILTRVVEEEREMVKEGAGSVMRSLNELLARVKGP